MFCCNSKLVFFDASDAFAKIVVKSTPVKARVFKSVNPVFKSFTLDKIKNSY